VRGLGGDAETTGRVAAAVHRRWIDIKAGPCNAPCSMPLRPL
jgi:hypothetical protein